MKKILLKGAKYVTAGTATAVAGGLGYLYYVEPRKVQADEYRQFTPKLDRAENLRRLMEEDFDVLVVGGGATGTSVALDCASRGLKCAVLERYDFASGTSSRSTKLLHGGVRYLQAAVQQLDPMQLLLVWHGLRERGHMLHATPFMTQPLPIVMPLYTWFDVAQMWAGILMYDCFGKIATVFAPGLPTCYMMTKDNAIFNFPLLQEKNMKAALMYYDGQQNDSRMNLSLAMTASVPNYIDGWEAAVIANHAKVTDVVKDATGTPCGLHVVDELTGEKFTVKGKVIVNCGGPFSDALRKKSDGENVREYIQAAAGAHIVLPKAYASPTYGMMIPETSDGRVLFYLPWENNVVAGTTDCKSDMTDKPKPTSEEIDFIVKESAKYLSLDEKDIRRDIKSAWSGLRPLVRDPKAHPDDTSKLSRDHEVIVDESGMVSVLGGKWTTCRLMAQDAMDTVLRVHKDKLSPKHDCRTYRLHLIDSHDASGTFALPNEHCVNDKLAMHLSRSYGLELDDAYHLSKNYGFRAMKLIEMFQSEPGMLSPFVSNQNFLRAEVAWACREEMAHKLSDVVMNRMRLSYVDAKETIRVLPEVASIMQKELGWTDETKQANIDEALSWVSTMEYANPDADSEAKIVRRRTYRQV